MQIRRHLAEDECLLDLQEYEEIFLGNCCGMALVKRGKNDNHICYIHLGEDDGAWSPCNSGSKSSYWLGEEMDVIKAVQEWITNNAEPDIYENNLFGRKQFGWKFKPIKE